MLIFHMLNHQRVITWDKLPQWGGNIWKYGMTALAERSSMCHGRKMHQHNMCVENAFHVPSGNLRMLYKIAICS